jgi:sugar phosphate isomerase/epimerase
MRFAFSTLACPAWTLEEAVARGREYGYDGIELRLIDGNVIPPHVGAGMVGRVRDATTEAGLDVVALDTSVRVTAEESQRVRNDILAYIELAVAWATPVVRVFGGALPSGPSERQEAFDRAVAVLAAVAPVAAAAGVTVAVETHDDFSASAVLVELLTRVPAVGIGAVWDSHHPYRMGESPAQVAANLGDRVALAQVKDARRDAQEPSGWHLVLLGEGEVPVREMAGRARDDCGLDWISVEWEKHWHPDIEPPEEALPQHLAVLRSWDLGGTKPRGEPATGEEAPSEEATRSSDDRR